ncbi:MAG: 3-methyl-2-oxobutanoate hydroxymethyltransferase [Spirochaetes bacterium]|nr:3-methyl-2-oxobutanoate hydroxymethyltransferase [Spirochaetota bacterium]
MSSTADTIGSRGFSIKDFRKYKQEFTPISMITCYDYSFARILQMTDIDTVLVGDSLGNVIAGYSSTLPVTLDQMIYHTEIVRRGAPSKFLIADMPFMSYHVSIEDTLRNAGRIMKETGANAVKLEGGRDFRDTVGALVRASIPVMGHLGLTPQSVQKFGGYSVQGRDADSHRRILEDATILEEAGVCAMVLEKIPESLAREISESISVPTIGIGAGRGCDGQVLVLNDLLGMDESFNPKFVKRYANLSELCQRALQGFHREVRERAFPEERHAYS